MRISGPILAQPPGQLYGRTVRAIRLAPAVVLAAEPVQAATLPPPACGDAARLTLLMAQTLGRGPAITVERVADAYRRPAWSQEATVSIVT